jgi:hypothetical protein
MPRIEGWEISDDCATPVDALKEHGLDSFADLVADFALEDIGPNGLGRVHRALRKQAMEQADRAFGLVLIWILAATNLDQVACDAVRETEPERRVNKGLNTVELTLPSGLEVPLEVTYLLEKKKRRAGRAKRHGNRGSEGVGCYPALEVLGFDSHRKLSSLIEEAVLHTGTACDDFRTGFEMAKAFGFEMSWKGYWSRFRRLGLDIRDRHDEWLFREHGPALFDAERWCGKRIVIAADGGRCRLRENHQGPPKKNGWHNFDAEWREPKLFVIYAIDDDGEALSEPEPIIDGTFGDADAFFERLAATLRQLEVWNASEVAFLGDGAPWIWKRARPMLEDLGVDEDAICEGIDFFHAYSALCKLSDLPDWTPSARTRWRRRARKALKAGDIEKVEEMIRSLSEHKGAKQALDKVEYFTDNEARMQFQERREENLPEGSGAMESGIRRVVNLRMKGNGKFWKEENAEAMLTVRSHLKTRRFDRLLAWWREAKVPWWTSTDRHRIRPSNRRLFVETSDHEPREVA